MASTKSILITGVTGKQGGGVLRQLASHSSASQFTLLAVTRNTSSPSAQKIVSNYPTALLVQGDLNDVPALFKSAQNALKTAGKSQKIWGVYSVQVSMGPGASIESEIVQGKALVDESIKHGVSHFVYSSVDRGGNEKSWKDETVVPHFRSKHQIEQHLLQKAGSKGEKMGWTILRPVAFMDNLDKTFNTKVFLAMLRGTLGAKRLQWVSTDDIGLFAAKAFRDPSSWNTRAESLAGDDLSFDEVNKAFKNVTGSPAPVTFGILGSALKMAVKELGIMVTWFDTDGYGADIKQLRAEEPELHSFERWLKERSPWKV